MVDIELTHYDIAIIVLTAPAPADKLTVMLIFVII